MSSMLANIRKVQEIALLEGDGAGDGDESDTASRRSLRLSDLGSENAGARPDLEDDLYTSFVMDDHCVPAQVLHGNVEFLEWHKGSLTQTTYPQRDDFFDGSDSTFQPKVERYRQNQQDLQGVSKSLASLVEALN
jgi:hypothetical protein